jgi:ATP-binding cassette subfamily F protein uup
MSTTRNLVNLSQVSKGFAAREILTDVTLGISEGDRIGVVGANGQGKSTLLDLIAGSEQPDSGLVTRLGSLRLGVLDQGDDLDPDQTVRGVLLGERAEHEWAADRVFRGVLDGLLGGVEFSRFTEGVETRVRALSGGERRRIALARVLLDHPDLLLLDEPTNHLDVEVISWLARHLAARSGAMLIVTHDRWFLDEVCTNTWEVSDGTIHQYEGGYAAYVLARAERDRQASSREDKRRQLVRKELAWLRRGPPARTAKPKFRIEAANTLIADEPPARDTTELLRFANSRLGNKVINAEDVSYAYDDQRVINEITWRLGPGERLALVGANGSGKSTLMSLLAQELTPTTGWVDRGETVKLAYLSQSAAELPEHLNVLAAVEEIRKRSTLADGSELTAGKLAERFGFRGEKTRTLVRDLSGGERRRLVLMRLLMSEPNVLLLDEPTNDLDIDTLTALEDLLDQWPGTLVVISHDRYFIERVCDNVFALTQNGGIRHLPGGVDQYIADLDRSSSAGAPAGQRGPATRKAGKDAREARKQAQRLERELERQTAREQELHELMATSSSDHARLSELTVELQRVNAERERLETAWLEAAETLEA